MMRFFGTLQPLTIFTGLVNGRLSTRIVNYRIWMWIKSVWPLVLWLVQNVCHGSSLHLFVCQSYIRLFVHLSGRIRSVRLPLCCFILFSRFVMFRWMYSDGLCHKMVNILQMPFMPVDVLVWPHLFSFHWHPFIHSSIHPFIRPLACNFVHPLSSKSGCFASMDPFPATFLRTD